MLVLCPTGTENYLCPIDRELLNDAKVNYTKNPSFVLPQFSSFAELCMTVNGISEPRDWKEALELYHCLLQELETV